MARMKIEVMRARSGKFGLSLHDRLVGYLPRYAPYAARMSWLMNLRDRLPGAASLSEQIAGFSAQRSLPKWRSDYFRDLDPSWPGLSRPSTTSSLAAKDVDARHIGERSDAVLRTAMAGHDGGASRDVVLFVDTFNRYFERENIDAAIAVLGAAGYRVRVATPNDGGRPLCCGRTFLSVGKVDEAREEAERALAALAPFAADGVPVIGLEPSCLFSFRDEIPSLIRSDTARSVAHAAFLFEEFLTREAAAGKLDLKLAPMKKRIMLHGHCHQKSFDTMTAVQSALKMIPDLEIAPIESSCCGMAGAFGYHADTIDVSRAMGELSLLPAVRKADADAIIVADGTSCRHQIKDGTGREAIHVVRVLASAIAGAQ
jgi:Fe-S oxidoreductase